VCVSTGDANLEICDGIDNDCDGQFDEEPDVSTNDDRLGEQCGVPEAPNDQPPCKAGTTVCVDGAVECEGSVGPTDEICDGLDNDCDGETDTRAPCPNPDDVCQDGECYEPCRSGEFPCPGGYECNARGVCVPRPAWGWNARRARYVGRVNASRPAIPRALPERPAPAGDRARPDKRATLLVQAIRTATPVPEPRQLRVRAPVQPRGNRNRVGSSVWPPAAAGAPAALARSAGATVSSAPSSCCSRLPSGVGDETGEPPGRCPHERRLAVVRSRVRVVATLAAPALALVASGCDTKAYCFNDCTVIGAGGADDPGQGTGGLVGLQPDSGTDADAATAGASTLDAGPPCDDTESDPLNCGACGVVCEITAALPACVHGQCVIESCATGRYDLNDDPDDGCEYRCIPTDDEELCDGLDNDCDGELDEDFDLDADPDNCGACGNTCSLFSSTAECAQPDPDHPAVCVVGECADGFHDANGVPSDGCEYECTPTGEEVCDAIDNDCDGIFNEDVPGTDEPCQEICPDGVCQGQCTPGVTSCVGTDILCRPGDEHLGPELEVCDGADNDCDGETDEGFDVETDPNHCGAAATSAASRTPPPCAAMDSVRS